MNKVADRQGKPPLLRLSVDGGGCAGFSYKFGLAEAIDPDDSVAETDGVTLVVDSVSLGLLDGSQVDFVEDLGGAAFQGPEPQRRQRLRLRQQLLHLNRRSS